VIVPVVGAVPMFVTRSTYVVRPRVMSGPVRCLTILRTGVPSVGVRVGVSVVVAVGVAVSVAVAVVVGVDVWVAVVVAVFV
jgi:hypothetical protein